MASWLIGDCDCIDVVVEAKMKITMKAFGEVINYARHICYMPPTTSVCEEEVHTRTHNSGVPRRANFLLFDVTK